MSVFLRRMSTGFHQRQRFLAGWRRLTPEDRRDALAMAILIPAMAATLRVIGFHRTVLLIDWMLRNPPEPIDDRAVERRHLRALRLAARRAPYRGNCLSQSLALWVQLRRGGLVSTVRFGARLDQRAFSAHAWVERAGRVLNDEADVAERFAPFESAPRARLAP